MHKCWENADGPFTVTQGTRAEAQLNQRGRTQVQQAAATPAELQLCFARFGVFDKIELFSLHWRQATGWRVLPHTPHLKASE